MKGELVKIKHVSIVAFLIVLCLALPTFAQQAKTVTKGPIVIQEVKHDTGPVLREVAPLFAEYGVPAEHEIENPRNPNHPWSDKVERDPVLQTAENSPTLQTPSFNVEFDGIGYGDSFFCNCMPPDNDGAPGTTQYVQYVNTTYQVFDKKGNTILGPLSGNDFWSGFGGSCQTDNSGDPTIRFDAAAQRWVVNQFAINNSGDDYDCIAVSQTADATGAYNRYAYAFGDFPDYPKLGVWPDAYYLTFNNFNLAGSAFVGANVCAADRASMLAGTSAQLICFQQNGNQFGMLPSDLDGATPPATGTPNFVVELDPDGSANLSMFKFHVDFTTPKNSTFTGPTLIPVPAFTPLCGGGDCVKQPTALSDSLEGLADRLMYRLVYRNFGDHTVLMVNHTITAGNSSGVRWYEIHNPESTPALYQSGTFAPDAQYRWMGGMAMDQAQDIAIGFSRSGSAAGQYPSLVYAGRVPTDTLGTMEGEVTLLAGLGSQSSGGKDRWGDYASVTIDPTDDCTFWFTQEYLKSTGQNGGFNWSTAIGSFNFPGCGGTPNFSLNAIPSSVSVAEGGTATTTVNVVPVNGFTGSVTLSKLSGLPTGVTVGFSPNPTTTSSTLTFTASGTAAKGTSTVTIQGVSGGLTQTAMLNLTVTGGSGGGTVTLTPGSLVWGNVVVGVAGAPKNVTLKNGGSTALTITKISATGDFGLGTSAKPCVSPLAAGASCMIKVTFTPTELGALTGTLSVTDNATGSPQTVSLSGTGTAQATLTPTSDTYTAQTVGTTSAAKVFTLANKQSVALTGISPSATGDFSISSTTCSSSLAAKTSCKISVVFKPTAIGTRTGELQVSDSAVGSPQTSSLTGTGK